jgi:hypothetical protein
MHRKNKNAYNLKTMASISSLIEQKLVCEGRLLLRLHSSVEFFSTQKGPKESQGQWY